MKKQAVNWIVKALFAGILAFALLCLGCLFYFNTPVHFDNPDGATEYKYESGAFFRGTEGYGYGRVNNDGFNNARGYTPKEKIDVLLMGSSHMEGFCVPQKNTAAAVLNRLFDGKKYAYSIGMAGHTFLYCAKHLEQALETYAPEDWVVLELATLSYDPAAMDAACDGTLPDMPSHTGKLVTALQEMPYLRLFYTKYVKGANEAVAAAAGTAEPVGTEEFEASLSRLLRKIGEVSAARGVKTMLVYTPTVLPNEDGRIETDARPGERECFARLCAENGLVFLDLTERNIAAVEEDGRLPFGFANTAPGTGHINSLGLRLYAEAVHARIEEGEG